MYKRCVVVYSYCIGRDSDNHKQPMTTITEQLDYIKVLISEQETAYQQHFAAGRLDEMMKSKRELAKYRNAFGRLLKQKIGM